MIIKTADIYTWREAPIEMCVDEEMAEYVANILRGEIKEAINEDEFKKGLDFLRSLNVLEKALQKLAEHKAKEARKAKEDAEKALEEYQSEQAVLGVQDCETD